jgi:hypothetical protein
MKQNINMNEKIATPRFIELFMPGHGLSENILNRDCSEIFRSVRGSSSLDRSRRFTKRLESGNLREIERVFEKLFNSSKSPQTVLSSR